MKDSHSKVSNENLSFETLLGELSAELVNLQIESLDTVIESSMKMLVEFFDADRSHLGAFSNDHTKIEVSYFYSRPGIDIPQITDVGEHYLSYVYESIKKDKLIAIGNTHELPDQAKQGSCGAWMGFSGSKMPDIENGSL